MKIEILAAVSLASILSLARCGREYATAADWRKAEVMARGMMNSSGAKGTECHRGLNIASDTLECSGISSSMTGQPLHLRCWVAAGICEWEKSR